MKGIKEQLFILAIRDKFTANQRDVIFPIFKNII